MTLMHVQFTIFGVIRNEDIARWLFDLDEHLIVTFHGLHSYSVPKNWAPAILTRALI